MKGIAKIMIVGCLIAVTGAVMILKQGRAPAPSGPPEKPAAAQVSAPLPKLLDLGADQCVPCKAMAPILEEMKKEFAGRLDVEFVDVWKTPGAAEKQAVEIIPTQIFLDANGKELFRHTGFFSREDILAKWKELGVDLSVKP